MDKITGFSLTYGDLPPAPPWLADYPWLSKMSFVYDNGFKVTMWGHWNLDNLISEDGTITVCQDNCYDMNPLDSTGAIIEKMPSGMKIKTNMFKCPPIFYGSANGRPYVSTCEECVLQGLGGATIGKGRLASFLIHQGTTATLTLWEEIGQMDANSELTISPDGSFQTKRLQPMIFPEINPAEYADMLTEVIRSYTEPLGNVHLAMSGGYDSRLVMVLADRPERIGTWTVPLSKPWERNSEYVWASRSAELWGAKPHMVELHNGLAPYMQPFIEYRGASSSGWIAYIFAIMAFANREMMLPMLSGIMADSVAGSGYNDVVARKVVDMGLADQFIAICRDWGDMRWTDEKLDAALAFDWREELDKIKPRFIDVWGATEGPNFQARTALLRIRNRTANMIRPAFEAADLWGKAVTPYADTRYISWMLALPEELRKGRKLVVDTATTTWPHIFNRPSGLTDDSYDSDNTLDEDLASEPWPLNGFAHDLFKAERVQEISQGASAVDMPSVRQAWALQPIAWAMKQGYVK